MQRVDWPRPVLLAVLLAAVAVGAVVAIATTGFAGSARAAAVATSVRSQPPAATPEQSAASPVPVAALVKPVDALRIRSGCRPLVSDDALRRAAQARVAALAEQGGVSHVDDVGQTAQDRVRGQGYTGDVIELVASGTLRPVEFGAALTQLVKQTDLLDCRYRSVGAAVADRHLVMVLGDG